MNARLRLPVSCLCPTIFFMKKILILPALLLALTVTACGTFQGMTQDVDSAIGAVSERLKAAGYNKKDEVASVNSAPTALRAIDGEGNCPPIIIDPQFDKMAEFYDIDAPSENSVVSRIRLTGTEQECAIDGDKLTVQVNLFFSGELGPKAKRKDGDRPFFAYPYFVAISDQVSQQELAREIFAASLTYDRDQETIKLIETIRQKLPLAEDGTIPAYEIQIGFQLTEEQLFYNAAQQ